MKVWNKPFRYNSGKNLKNYDIQNNENNRHYGITDWMVGSNDLPWKPWIQFHFGYHSLQVKWYIVVALMVVFSFGVGFIAGNI